MKIEKLKKMTNGRYKIYTDEEEFILYEDVILKYNLLSKKEINLKLLSELLKENKYYEVYNICIKYIEIKMRSKYELIKYLEKKEIDAEIIEKVIIGLSEIGLLDDSKYLKAFVNDKINLSNIGPYKIKQELIKNQIDEYKIDEYLKIFNEDVWIQKIEKIVYKKQHLNKNKSNIVFKQTVCNELKSLGYPYELINEVLKKLNINNQKLLEIQYKKTMTKLSKKYENEKLNFMIKSELLKKGFDYSEIEEYMRNE